MVSARASLLFLALAASAGGCGERQEVVASAGTSGPRVDPPPDDPAEFGALPDFHLTDERGEEVALADLRGRPLVFGALFTTCTGPCPSIAHGLGKLQEELADTDARIVVVSVDPTADTPAVLARYAERVGAQHDRWLFLTGPEDAVKSFVQHGLFMALDRDATEGLTHDVRLLAVDRAGRRRGWYTGTDENQLERLRRRVLHLAAEPR